MGMPRGRRSILALCLSSAMGLGVLSLASGDADGLEARQPAAKAGIEALSAVRDGEALLVSFRLDRALDERTWEKIESGLPTGFTYDIEVRKRRRYWFDQRVGATRLQVMATHNALTREYLVNFKRDGELYASQAVTSTSDLEQALTVFEQLPSMEIPDDDTAQLLLRVRAELGARTVLGLIPDRVHTAWAEQPVATVSRHSSAHASRLASFRRPAAHSRAP